jgi:alginate O-acetyltransferase complex protein AlgI
MVFSSLVFLGLFLPLVWLLHTVLPRQWRNYWLLLASLFFYAWGEGELVLVMLSSILFNYGIGLVIERSEKPATRKKLLALGLIANLGLLGVYKYQGFIVSMLNDGLFALDLNLIRAKEIPLPIGISFFTFQALSYVIDLYRQKHPAQRNPFHLGLYIALFPQLIAGPIVRYQEIYAQIKDRVLSTSQMSQGVQRFLIGLAKKLLIADSLAFVVDKIFLLPESGLSTGLAWLAMLSYSLQIYYDFSGYSDMAIGLGAMLGFDIPENFRYPYMARSIREFWRRWHITLSTWFRDYLYLPLGGSRTTKIKVYRNLWLVFLLCGFWHGASWTFVIWGAFHGTFLVLERGPWGKWLERSPRWLSHVYTLLVVLVAWVLFRAETFGQAGHFLQYMAGLGENHPVGNAYAWFLLQTEAWLPLLAGIIFAGPVYLWWEQKLENWGRLRFPLEKTVVLVLMALSILTVLNQNYTPFIYFRF